MSNFSPMRWALQKIRAVPAEDLYAKEEELKQSQRALLAVSIQVASLGSQTDKLTNDLSVANAAKARANQTIQQNEWTHPYHVEFLWPRNKSKNLVQHTMLAWSQFGNGVKLGVRSQFKGGINPAGLYWALTHASVSGSKAIAKRKRVAKSS